MVNYINIIRSVKEKYFFNADSPSSNRACLNNLFGTLLSASMNLNSTTKSKYIDILKNKDIMQFLNGLRFEADYQPLAFCSTKAMKEGNGYPLIEFNGQKIVALYDFGTMSTGVFSESDFHQYALVFHDPTNEDVEVGFSLNVKGGPTVIIPPFRVELYPSYALLSESLFSYKSMKYYDLTADDYQQFTWYDENGTKKEPTLWEKFKSL